MLTEYELSLWQKVTATVRRLGESLHPSRQPRPMPRPTVFASVLDLHNTTIQNAYRDVRDFIEAAIASGCPSVTIITGKSGRICQEFPFWMERLPVRSWVGLNGGGAFKVILPKPKAVSKR